MLSLESTHGTDYAVLLSKKHQRSNTVQEEGLTRHHLLLLHKQVQNKSDIEESLHAYINRARISAYENMRWANITTSATKET